MTPYEKGRAAARTDIGEACPFKGNTHEYESWLAGYLDCRAQQAKAKAEANYRLRAAAFHAGVRIHSFDRWEV